MNANQLQPEPGQPKSPPPDLDVAAYSQFHYVDFWNDQFSNEENLRAIDRWLRLTEF